LIEWLVKPLYMQDAWYYQLFGMDVSEMIQSHASGLVSTFTFGGTTLLIVVGVAIETYRELEAQLTMRNYKGFLN
jgi:preprotein translocase subunit SecY